MVRNQSGDFLRLKTGLAHLFNNEYFTAILKSLGVLYSRFTLRISRFKNRSSHVTKNFHTKTCAHIFRATVFC